MANNDQAETPRQTGGEPAGEDALSRFLNWMKAAIGPARASEIGHAIKTAHLPREVEPADLGLPLLNIVPTAQCRVARRPHPPTARLPRRPQFPRPNQRTQPNPQHEDHIRRRFKL